jgi:Sulfotransferase family
MPIVRIAGQLIYFAHVPKCAGTAVELYLQARFGPLALRDPRHTLQTPAQRWTRSSPQHVDRVSLSRLIPPGFIDASFAVVRHPVDRLLSTYHFQSEVHDIIPPDQSLSDWLAALPGLLAADPFYADNHCRPMGDLVPEGAVVFPLEAGLDPVVDWLDRIAGNSTTAHQIRVVNRRGTRPGYPASLTPRLIPRAADVTLIEQLYAADMVRFGYGPYAGPVAAEGPGL